MKNLSIVVAISTLLLLPLSSLVKAQDVPPPPPDQSATGGDQGGPAPDEDDSGDQGASFQDFYDQLGSQGTWIQTDDYGYVFQPNVSDPNWAPYTEGHWVYTDVGWTWVSDEPWGWATYHYGRWANIDGTGWVWVPGYRWAPAWVSWRYGGGYAGWAPLPPETFYGVDYAPQGGVFANFHFGGDVDVTFNIGPGCYNFVPVNYMGERNYHSYYVDRSRNYVVINNTTNITNIYNTRSGNFAGAAGNLRAVTVGGPPINEINAHSQVQIQRVALTTSRHVGPGQLEGNSLAVYAPRVRTTNAAQARPAQIAGTISHPSFNRGDSIEKPLAVTSTVRPQAPSAEAVQAATEARAHAPSRAKVATANTRAKVHFSQPLTALKPIGTTHAAATSATMEAKPSVTHAVGSEYTGESEKPAPASHPESENTVEVYHAPASSVYHAPSENNQVYHPESSQVYHAPSAEVSHPEAMQEEHHAESNPAVSHAPASQVEHAPAPQFSHPASAMSHPAAAASHPQGGQHSEEKGKPGEAQH